MKALIERWKAPLNEFWKNILKWSVRGMAVFGGLSGAILSTGMDLPKLLYFSNIMIILCTTISACAKLTKS